MRKRRRLTKEIRRVVREQPDADWDLVMLRLSRQAGYAVGLREQPR